MEKYCNPFITEGEYVSSMIKMSKIFLNVDNDSQKKIGAMVNKTENNL